MYIFDIYIFNEFSSQIIITLCRNYQKVPGTDVNCILVLIILGYGCSAHRCNREK